MNITDEIRNYQVRTALSANRIKYSREYLALAVLKYAFADSFGVLHKAEKPDLQDMEGNLGVEVTWGGSPKAELISGESEKYLHAKNDAERSKCLAAIRNSGGDRDEISTSFPVETTESEKIDILRVFRKKLKKVNKYRSRFRRVGLAILLDIPMIFFSDFDWGQWLSEVNGGGYDFVVLIHWSGADLYDFTTKEYVSKRIEREDMDALKKLGRMAAEEIISDDSAVWK